MRFTDYFSQREQKLLGTLLVDVLVAGYYFWHLLALPDGLNQSGTALAELVVKVVLVAIVASIVVFSVLGRNSEAADERDLRIAERGTTLGYRVLFALCAGLAWQMAAATVGLQSSLGHWLTVPASPLFYAHLLLMALLLASFAKGVYQLLLYRGRS